MNSGVKMYYIGVDLAWTTKNETGICILEENKCIYLESEVFTDDEIVRLILNYQPCIVSIDAPLVVVNETGGRTVDSLLMKTCIHNRYLKLYATSRSYMLKTFKVIRGENILKKLPDFELGKTIVETYPTGIYLSLYPELFDCKYKLSSRNALEKLKFNAMTLVKELNKSFEFKLDLEDIRTKKAYKHIEDKLDGLLCAVNSYYLDNQQCTIWKDESGCISLPIILNL